MLRYCSAGEGSIKGGGMEPPGKKRRNLRSSFPQTPRARCSPTTHDCSVDSLMSVYSSVLSSTWLPTSSYPFFSASISSPLSLPTFEIPVPSSRRRTAAILGLVNSESTQISVRALFTRQLIIFPCVKATILIFSFLR